MEKGLLLVEKKGKKKKNYFVLAKMVKNDLKPNQRHQIFQF